MKFNPTNGIMSFVLRDETVLLYCYLNYKALKDESCVKLHFKIIKNDVSLTIFSRIFHLTILFNLA